MVENFWMTGSLLEKKNMWNSDVVTEEELDYNSAWAEPSLRKSVLGGCSKSAIKTLSSTGNRT